MNWDMKLIVIAAAVVIIGLVVFAFKITNIKKAILDQVDEVLFAVEYGIGIILAIILCSALVNSIDINPILEVSILMLVLGITNNFISNSQKGQKIPLESKKALSFVGMLGCAILFAIYAIISEDAERSYVLNMLYYVLTVIFGYYISLDVVLSDKKNIKEKIKVIISDSGIKNLKKPCLISFLVVVFLLLGRLAVFKIESIENVIGTIDIGIFIGIFIGLFLMALIIPRRRCAIKNCFDTRCEIFNKKHFQEFLSRILNCLGYSINEKFDIIESVILYNIYIKINKTEEACQTLVSNNNYIKNYEFYKDATFNSYRTGHNTLRIGKTIYIGDYLTLPYPLLREYINQFHKDAFGIKNISESELAKLKDLKLDSDDIEMLKFLDAYHHASKKDKKSIFPKEIRRFYCVAYDERASLVVPYLCYKNRFQNINSDFCELVYGNRILKIIYDYYNSDTSNHEKMKMINDLYDDDRTAKRVSEWLTGFDDWSSFIRLNHLESFVNIKKKWFKTNIGEPRSLCNNISVVEGLLPKDIQDVKQMFLCMAKQIEKREY